MEKARFTHIDSVQHAPKTWIEPSFVISKDNIESGIRTEYVEGDKAAAGNPEDYQS